VLEGYKWGIIFGSKPSERTTNHTKIRFRNISHANPFDLFSKIHNHYDYTYLLESIEGPRKLTQYSFIGFDPQAIITVKNGEIVFTDVRERTSIREIIDEPLSKIKEILERNYLPFKELRLIGGAIGYFSYDAIRYWENLPKSAKDDLNFPDIELAIYDDGIIFDHGKQSAFYYYLARNRLKDLERLMKSPLEIQSLQHTEPKTNLSKESFEEEVTKAKEYIVSGDILQVVLSKRYEITLKGDLLQFYKSLRRINPSPYMYFLKMKERQIVGSSPEMLVRIENGVVETYPIAGTRPIAVDNKKNEALAKELLNDPKERAEHIMLVDLARNDIGKVSEYGSVHVPQFMEVHKYSHVQHIVSRVAGKLKPNCDSFDSLKAIFPAGTVSGAPKIRAMEIIEEAEPTRRGPYAGGVGYFSFNGNSDFAITIRTLMINGNKGYIQVGGGIVADSVPEREWFETDYKAQALMMALKASGED
jgi:anthranilate synthase component 1